ncbi:MAG: hypothetical protein AAFR96_10565 [Planctomycetota bacterium]
MRDLDRTELIEGVHWWELAGHYEPEAMVREWRQVHYAAQAVAEAGKGWARARDDDSHSSLIWVPDTRKLPDQFFASVVTEAGTPLRALLRPWDLKLFVIDGSGAPLAERDIEGCTLDEATGWVRKIVEEHGGDELQETSPAPDLPEDDLAKGASFREPAQLAIAEVIRLYGNTDALLERLAALIEDTDEPKTWPHHFDHALLATVDRDADSGDASATIGIGLTPPDSVSDEGYWYVSPWSTTPRGEGCDWPAPGRGRWIDRGGPLKMAILPISAVTESEDPREQHARVAAFVAESYNTCRAALGVRRDP